MPGEVVTIIGASGSGKSTLLRCINLLETPDAGHVWFHGQDLAAEHVDVNACARRSAWSSRDSTCSTT
jgi:putative lysine transport system ATP-binding protein